MDVLSRIEFCVLLLLILRGIVANSVSKTACAEDNPSLSRIIGLFKPLSYQDRAIRLAQDNQTIVCYEPLSTASDIVSWQDICELLSDGVLALISDQPLPSAVNDVITAAHIPVLSTSIITMDTNSTVVSIAPSEEQLASALSTLIKYNQWTDVILLTWQGSGLELLVPGSCTSYRATLVYYIDTSNVVIKSSLSRIKQSGISVIILHHYNLDKMLNIFQMAAEEGLNAFPYIWILLGKTAEMLINEISRGNVFSQLPRILAVYPVISNNPRLSKFANTWKSYGSTKQLQSAAYLYDAFKILSDSVAVANRMDPDFTQIQGSCDSLEQWQFSDAFQAILVETMATTQRLIVENSIYHYFSVDQYALNKVGILTEGSNELNQTSFIHWCSELELNNVPLCHQGSSYRCSRKVSRPKAQLGSNYQYDYSQYSFDIITLQAEPFIYVTQDENGGEVFKGLCIDLLNKLSDKMGFDYTIRLVADGQYGGKLEDGSWTGLVGDLVNHRAEIAVAPLTITSDREIAIDFTKGYYNLGLRILYNSMNDDDQYNAFNLFNFWKPFEAFLWLLILGSTVAVSLALAIIGRLSPYDYYQCPPDGFSLWESRFQMKLFNSVWQTLSAVLQQGAETAPRSTSARILLGGWWFVCLVLGATFTANLTAIFATEEGKSGFNSIEELISKIPPNIPFGTLINSQPAYFFEISPIRQHQEAFEYMHTEGLLFNSEDEALSAVLYDNVAYIFDSPVVDYISSRRGEYNPKCTLGNIGEGLFFPVIYGLGLTKDSPYTDDFSLAILELVEEGEIERLTTEYFEYQRTCVSEVAMSGVSTSMDTEQISLDSVGGLFILLGIAIIISLFTLLIELAYHSLLKPKNSLDMKLPHKCKSDVQLAVQEVSSLNSIASEVLCNTNTEL